jgi:RNA polymerase sigma-70 factor (ECF subfamily)
MTAAARPDPRPTSAGVDPDRSAVRAAQRDRSAFDVLYRRYVEAVYGYAFYLLGDHHDAEDATERTFLSALGAVERFRADGGTFRSWLFRIAHNAAMNSIRTRRRRRTAPLESTPEPRDPAADPAGVIARAEERRSVRAAVATLPLERRQVIVLRFVDGLSAREIGRILDRSEGAVRVLQHRALRDLAERLEAEVR